MTEAGKRGPGQRCIVCTHPALEQITADIFAGVGLRDIGQKYGMSHMSVKRHIERHVSAAMLTVARAELEASRRSKATQATDARQLARAELLVRPILTQMRELQARCLALLEKAEKAKDTRTAFIGIREVRRNYELIGRLTGEMDSRSPGESPGERNNITIIYADKAAISVPGGPGGAVGAPEGDRRQIEAPGAQGEAVKCRN